MLIPISGPAADACRAIKETVAREWTTIRGTLARKLRKRGVPISELDDAIGEAAGFLWQSLQRGESIGFAIWWAVGRYCSGRRFSGDRQPQWDREERERTQGENAQFCVA